MTAIEILEELRSEYLDSLEDNKKKGDLVKHFKYSSQVVAIQRALTIVRSHRIVSMKKEA